MSLRGCEWPTGIVLRQIVLVILDTEFCRSRDRHEGDSVVFRRIQLRLRHFILMALVDAGNLDSLRYWQGASRGWDIFARNYMTSPPYPPLEPGSAD